MHSINIFNNQENFVLESGEVITGLQLHYQTFGTLNEYRSNVIWIVHALTANDNPVEWWPGVVGENCPIDPNEYFIICVNNPGSPYGSISPLSINPASNEPYYHDFPIFTTRDIARSFDILRKQLGLDKIQLLIGASVAGQIAMEWAIESNTIFEKLLLLVTNAKQSPWAIAFNESQRLAIEADSTWKEKHEDAGKYGLKAARSIALLSYRSYTGYNKSQEDNADKIKDYRAASYQAYQGDKLVKRYNAFSYYAVTRTMDSHNIGRGRKSIIAALQQIKAKTTIIGITTDFLFPIEEQKYLANHIPNADYIEIYSAYGHDGFLIEAEEVNNVITSCLNWGKIRLKVV